MTDGRASVKRAGFPRPPYNRYRPQPIRPSPAGAFIRVHARRRVERVYRAGADHYQIRLFGWRLIFRLERDEAVL